ncbi:MAG: 4Fe-4S binding protein [Proteobacteria bacterium]|nr:4Fe-4S binding protein [Pseudomonadota bacterium]
MKEKRIQTDVLCIGAGIAGLMPPVIDREKCTACGACVEYCAEDVFFGSEEGRIPQVTPTRNSVPIAAAAFIHALTMPYG